MNTPLLALAIGCAVSLGAAAADAGCRLRTGAQRLVVLELYTSEGCSSCPPAERWLNALNADSGVLPLAFHVDYWDRLGWADAYASARHTERQYQRQSASGARFVYTPQMLLDGRDWRGWVAGLTAPASSGAPAAVLLDLERGPTEMSATVSPRPGQPLPARLSGYWAVLEDGLVTQVRSGENAGARLQHNHVVRRYEPLPTWPAGEVRTWHLPLSSGATGQAQRAALVVTDAATGLPLQAAVLRCNRSPG